MQASTCAVKGTATSISVGSQPLNRRRLLAVCGLSGGYRKSSSLSVSVSSFNNNSYMTGRISFCGLRPADSVSMGTELVRTAFSRSRLVKALSSDGDIEEAAPIHPQTKSSGIVCRSLVCLLGAILLDIILRWIVSTLLDGATVGSFTGGALADKFGRTRNFQLDAIPLIIGAFLCTTAQSISPTEIRGALGSVNQLFICMDSVGISGWTTISRKPFMQGKISEAEKSIRTLYGKERVAEIMQDLAVGGQVVSVGVALFFFQQMAGINAVVYYSTAVFRVLELHLMLQQVLLLGHQMSLAQLWLHFNGQTRKKKSSNYKLLGMAASMLLCFVTFTWKVLAPYSGTLAVLGLFAMCCPFHLAGPVPASLLPEIFASRIRAKAVALSLGMHWISNFFIGLYFLSVVNKFGISTVYLGFAAICLLAVLYIAGNVVETKGRSLEEIERALNPAI
ncbi:hypothetical protein GH714_032546 [Hevea brasiliensis]|uniref:Major facilitator superfamily (MFS) profile domain-containing protein n=1 Tax=Hevea brasiliensis TaxID=3981 RepID=A0A6A6L1Y0_HEVBR|nr:hypothetical protein GH714_032546 [Hevea brasiliensis]